MKKQLFFSFLLCVFLNNNCTITNKLFKDVELYPVVEPYQEGYLQVTDLHEIYYAQFGNPQGKPVLVIHGGPGGGCSKELTKMFDLDFYRVIMFDQRGAKRSRPFASMVDNTPQAAVEDMETIREYLAIEKWFVFGGSCGSMLSILYGETHPGRVIGFILRGIFLGREKEYEHLFYGMNKFFPEAWQDMVNLLPENERDDLIPALHKRVMDPDPEIYIPIAYSFMFYDCLCARLCSDHSYVKRVLTYETALSIGRAFIHYSANRFFFEENQLLNNIKKINHLPAIMVQGRYDLICPPENAYDLYKEWPGSKLWFVSNGGHSMGDPAITQGLKIAMEEMKDIHF